MFPIPIENDIYLDLLKLGDEDELFPLVENNRTYLREWLPWLDTYQKKEDSKNFIQASICRWASRQSLTLGIFYQGYLAGIISFHTFDWGNETSSIGYWLSSENQGKGIMTKACMAIIDFGFSELGLQTTTICCSVENAKSQSIPKRLGFTYKEIINDKEWLYDHYVDHKVFTISSKEWKSNY